VVLVDQAAEYLPALHRHVHRYDDRFVMIGWPLLPGLMRPMSVIVPGAGPQHRPQTSFAVDQQPVRALRPDRPHPALGITIRPRRPGRNPHDPHALAGEDSIERASELSVTVPDEEPERADPVREVRNQVASLLRDPGTVWIPGHPEDMHPPGRYLHDEQHIQALEEDRVHGKKVARQQAVRLGAKELPPRGFHMTRGRVPCSMTAMT
jgi:hypothetical protein